MLSVTYRSLIVAISGAQALLATPAVAQQSDIEVSYVEVQNAISPRPGIFRVPRTVQVRVAEDNTLAVEGRSQYGPGRVRTTSEQVRAGEETQSDMTTSRWRVGGANVLIRETTFPRHVVRTTIRVNGKTCEATVSFHLNRDATQYQMRWAPTGETALFHAIHAENVTCKITGG